MAEIQKTSTQNLCSAHKKKPHHQNKYYTQVWMYSSGSIVVVVVIVYTQSMEKETDSDAGGELMLMLLRCSIQKRVWILN